MFRNVFFRVGHGGLQFRNVKNPQSLVVDSFGLLMTTDADENLDELARLVYEFSVSGFAQ